MPNQISIQLIHKKQYWKVLGFMSSVIGLTCYALSSSFNHLFGDWNFFKITIYTLVSISISSIMLFMKKWKLSRSSLVKAHLGILVLLLTSFYSFVSDKAVNGKPDILSMISCAAFALMSFSLSRQIDLGFEADLLNFFLGCLTIQLKKINLMLSVVAAIFCYSLMVLRSKLDSQHEVGTLRVEDHVGIEIDDNISDHRSQSLRKRVYDGYNWKKSADKVAKGSEKQRSYYKCTLPNCVAKKKVDRTLDGEIIDTLYKGTHNHCKPVSTIKKSSSSEYLYSLLPSENVATGMLVQSLVSQGSEQVDSDAESDMSFVSV